MSREGICFQCNPTISLVLVSFSPPAVSFHRPPVALNSHHYFKLPYKGVVKAAVRLGVARSQVQGQGSREVPLTNRPEDQHYKPASGPASGASASSFAPNRPQDQHQEHLPPQTDLRTSISSICREPFCTNPATGQASAASAASPFARTSIRSIRREPFCPRPASGPASGASAAIAAS